MKKVIRWLANITGVSHDIKVETCLEAGRQMVDYHYWFNPETEKEIINVLKEYPVTSLLEGRTVLYGGRAEVLREKLRQLKSET